MSGPFSPGEQKEDAFLNNMKELQDEKWYLTTQTFPALLARNAERFGDRTAQRWHGMDGMAALTYAELYEIVREAACGLLDMGVEKGDRIAIMAPTCPQWMWADYAVLCAGGITVSIYPTSSFREAVYILNNSGTRMLFVGDGHIAARVDRMRIKVPNLETVVVLTGSERSKGTLSFAALRRSGVAFAQEHVRAFDERRHAVGMDDIMTLVYTSGTTGLPKGVIHTHRTMNAGCRRDLAMIPSLTKEDCLLSLLPLAHTFERQCGHGVAMQAAVSIAYGTPQTFYEDLKAFSPTFFMSVPRIYERIYKRLQLQLHASSGFRKRLFERAIRVGCSVIGQRIAIDGWVDMTEGKDVVRQMPLGLKLQYRLMDKLLFSKAREQMGGRLRFAFSAAGSLPADLCKLFLAMGIPILEGYGSTETCNTLTLNPIHRILPGSVGAPCIGVTGRMGKDGEWEVKGEALFMRYWNQPDATADAFTDDGFFKTGDIVEPVSPETIRIIDRKKGLLVLDTGKTVSSSKVESLFLKSNMIDTVVPVATGQKYVTALIIPDLDGMLAYLDNRKVPYDRDALTFENGHCMAAGQDVVTHSDVVARIAEEVQFANRLLEPHERIKYYHITNRKLQIERGELTPTLKVRRNTVLANFADAIALLYQ
ncbi:MAG: hypothetical protein CSA22_02790 [Deltaproteobacteria bacterium]|nr:MAG: hypothetical protein CSA22_02790 [Deltaproteobacteria bacterium]